MSVFKPVACDCPACGSAIRIDACDSVNGVRRPDLRRDILEDRFQRTRCSACRSEFRIDPAFTYLDVERGQWMLVRPAGDLPQWQRFEAQARAIHAEAFGADADAAARTIGARLTVRVTFGWPALREKLLCAAHGIDDVVLELLKLALLRQLGDLPLSDTVELRLVDAGAQLLRLAWLQAADGARVEQLEVPREMLAGLADEGADWQALRAELAAAPYVDWQRFVVEPA